MIKSDTIVFTLMRQRRSIVTREDIASAVVSADWSVSMSNEIGRAWRARLHVGSG